MIRGATAATAALALTLLAGGAYAADKDTSESAPAPETPPAAAAPAKTGSLGVPYLVRQGFWVEAQVGMFTAFGGSKGASNSQVWVDVQLGFDIPGVKRLSLFVAAGHGFNDSSCRYFVNGQGCDVYSLADDTSQGTAATDFSVIPIELGARYGTPDFAAKVIPNLYVDVLATVGYTIYTPLLMQGAAMGSPSVGFGAGLQYDTRLPGFSFGIEIMMRLGFLPGIAATASNPALPSQVYPAFTAYPRFQYTF
jgi:hypothetical protein